MATNKRRSPRPDGRTTHTHLTEDVAAGGAFQFAHQAGSVVSVVTPIKLDDGRTVFFPAPQFVAFYLVESKRHLDRGEKLRAQIPSQTRQAESGNWTVTNSSLVIDCFAELSAAVLYAYTAVEALTNQIIEAAPDEFTLPHRNAKGEEVQLDKDEVVRRLSTSTKLDRVIPVLTGQPSLKGTVFWQDFVRLRRLRDALVHVKKLGYSNDAENPSEYGRLPAGEGKTCTLDAMAIVEQLQPDLLTDSAREQLGTLIRAERN